jgi:arsenate reductase
MINSSHLESGNALFPNISKFLTQETGNISGITLNRITILVKLGHWVASQLIAQRKANLTFICTHNSRRSQMAQVWFQAATEFVGLPGVSCYSGGTEVTACHPNTVEAFYRAGFLISKESETEKSNPRYLLTMGPKIAPITLFSKRFDAVENLPSDFAAITVCSDADEACPFVPGAIARIHLGFEDPKQSDGSAQQNQTYDQANQTIAREMLIAATYSHQLFQDSIR